MTISVRFLCSFFRPLRSRARSTLIIALAAAAFGGSFSMAAPRKVLFDTDSAYFLDDGAALVMLLQRQDLVEIVGVTVVSGNLWARQGAEHMLHLLELTGNEHIPLHVGASSTCSQSSGRQHAPPPVPLPGAIADRRHSSGIATTTKRLTGMGPTSREAGRGR